MHWYQTEIYAVYWYIYIYIYSKNTYRFTCFIFIYFKDAISKAYKGLNITWEATSHATMSCPGRTAPMKKTPTQKAPIWNQNGNVLPIDDVWVMLDTFHELLDTCSSFSLDDVWMMFWVRLDTFKIFSSWIAAHLFIILNWWCLVPEPTSNEANSR